MCEMYSSDEAEVNEELSTEPSEEQPYPEWEYIERCMYMYYVIFMI